MRKPPSQFDLPELNASGNRFVLRLIEYLKMLVASILDAQANAGGGGITQLTGDVTAGPGSGSQAATIANDAVTYAKMQNVSAASRLLGRGAGAGAGNPQEISLGSNLSMSGTTLNAAGGTTYDADEVTLELIGTTFSVKADGIGPTELAPTAVTPGTYANPTLTVDAEGRITDAEDGTSLNVGQLFFFGSGEDGNVVLDGTATFSWASKSGNTYTLTNTLMAADLTIDSGVTLIPGGFSIYVAGSMLVNGRISGDGSDGVFSHAGGNQSGAVGAWSGTGNTWGTGSNGGSSTGGAGGAGTNQTNSLGGRGGTGGAGATGAGGVSGTATVPGAPAGGPKQARALLAYISGRNVSGTNWQVIQGGSGGGAGGGDTGSGVAGGAGGGGGGVIGLYVSEIAAGGIGSVSVDGGDGGYSTTGNTGGGGGGGGGVIYLLTTTGAPLSVLTFSAAGGTGGLGIGTGTAGANGLPGTINVSVI